MRTSILITLSICLQASLWAENWPSWRGPLGTGVSAETAVPVRWDRNSNVSWKAGLRGLGVSSPIVWGDQILVTSQVGKGTFRDGSHPTLARGQQQVDERPMMDAASQQDQGVFFLVEAFHRDDGRLLWEYRLQADGTFPQLHSKHNMASPSPVTDGQHIYAWFATGQLIALDMRGKLVWKRHLGKEYSPFEISWGHGSSPTLYGELLILQCQHQPASYLLALDKSTGSQRWRVDQDSGVNSHCTPFVARRPEGDELIINTTQRVDAYNPLTGDSLWHAGGEVRFAIPVPSYDNGVLYMSRGYRSGPYLAIRTGGRGDVSDTHIVWRVATGAPYISSLVFHRGLVYMANGLGIVTCVDALTGNKVWQERIGGIYSASPVVADGRIYLLSESGETVVLQGGREPQVVARNPLEERTVASPAVSNGQIFIRSDRNLISIAAR